MSSFLANFNSAFFHVGIIEILGVPILYYVELFQVYKKFDISGPCLLNANTKHPPHINFQFCSGTG